VTGTDTAYVRCLAHLHTYRSEAGLPPSLDVEIPEEGLTVRALAERLELPIELVEGAFVNNRISGMDAVVHGGDRVAFVPKGTPASHPSFFGPFITRE
jgi:molybdopterin converting factor small subunit